MDAFPIAMWLSDEGRVLFHRAVVYRQENIFGLMYWMSEDTLVTASTDKFGNNMRLAGKLAHLNWLNLVSRAALQIQRELRWFKAVCVSGLKFPYISTEEIFSEDCPRSSSI